MCKTDGSEMHLWSLQLLPGTKRSWWWFAQLLWASASVFYGVKPPEVLVWHSQQDFIFFPKMNGSSIP